MLSDEITTGSVRTTESEKKILAKKSHEWNCKNVKFKTIFPEYATIEMKRLPNMGEFDLGKPDGPALPKDLSGSGSTTGTAAASSQSNASGTSSERVETDAAADTAS